MGSRKLKEKKVEELKNDLQMANVAVLTDFRGLTVAKMNKLRRMLAEGGVKYKVVKNTLTLLAAREVGLDELEPYLKGPVAIAFGYDDPVHPVKILDKFAKEHEELKIKGGILEKRVLGDKEIRRLSELPSKEVLLAKTLGCFKAPLTGFLSVLQGNLRNFVYVLNAIKEQKESA